MTVKIVPNEKGNPPGKLADAELHFTEGPLDGLKLIGFAVWERQDRRRPQRDVPGAAVLGQRRAPQLRAAAAGRRQRPRRTASGMLILAGVRRSTKRTHGAIAVVPRRCAAGVTGRSTGRNAAVFSFCRFGGSVHSSREALLELGAEERRLHAAVDDVPGQHRVAASGRGRCRSRRRRRSRPPRRASCRRCARPPRSPARRGGRRATAAPGSRSAAPT